MNNLLEENTKKTANGHTLLKQTIWTWNGFCSSSL